MNLLEKTRAALNALHPNAGAPPRFFRAPGRVNLIGEHTDYNDGFVLPAAIDFETVVAALPRPDSTVEVVAVDMDDHDTFRLAGEMAPHPTKTWANYVRGVAHALRRRGYPLRGLSMAVAGNVPTGSGLSSSASLEMAAGYALLGMSNLPIERATLARCGQEAEHEFVGVQCGIMDQFIAALGKPEHALLIDCRTLDYRPVPLPPHTRLVIADSGVRRGLVTSAYNTRRQECEAAAAHFGVPALRDVDEATFRRGANGLPPRIRRRARHVITENARTLALAKALADGDMARVAPLMAESHRSMRDDFEITVPAIDALVEIMQSVPGVYGARMTGGGFGGCCIALAPASVAPAVQQAIEQRYEAQTGYRATVYVCRASAGAGEVTKGLDK
ncbi:MAG: galactokinase [Caldilineae bacterium]|nr:MAG: galactokinase [Caldilineae bacterium]